MKFGAYLDRPLHLPAATLLARAATWVAHAMGGGTQVQPTANKPCLSAALIAGAQVVNVSLPGREPCLMNVTEDMTLFDPTLVSSWTGAVRTHHTVTGRAFSLRVAHHHLYQSHAMRRVG